MKIGKFIYNVISALILIIFVGLAVLLVGVKLVGFTPYAVLSSSMSPLYETGSVVYVKDVEQEEIKVDDVITFYMEDSSTVVTHQVVEIDEENGYYYTQGLANDTIDGTPVTIDRIIGKVYFGVPYLGYISDYVTSPPWIYIIIAVVLIWAIIVYMIDISKEKEETTAKRMKSEYKPERIKKETTAKRYRK
ncbi:MAG: signal peptidase I [Clostridia bacterium]